MCEFSVCISIRPTYQTWIINIEFVHLRFSAELPVCYPAFLFSASPSVSLSFWQLTTTWQYNKHFCRCACVSSGTTAVHPTLRPVCAHVRVRGDCVEVKNTMVIGSGSEKFRLSIPQHIKYQSQGTITYRSQVDVCASNRVCAYVAQINSRVVQLCRCDGFRSAVSSLCTCSYFTERGIRGCSPPCGVNQRLPVRPPARPSKVNPLTPEHLDPKLLWIWLVCASSPFGSTFVPTRWVLICVSPTHSICVRE